MAEDDSFGDAEDSGHGGKDDDDCSSEHINPNSIYEFMNRTENMLERIQKFDSVGCFYNLLDEAYISMLACCVLWYTSKWGAQAEQRYLGYFVEILDGFIDGAPELDKLLEEHKNPELEAEDRSMLDMMYNDYRARLLAAVGERSTGLMAKLQENQESRYATFYEKLDTLSKALAVEISSQQLGRDFGQCYAN
jgi:hypothetical protein